MEGNSSSLYIPDDMIEESFDTSEAVNPTPVSNLQPKSLRSLANFTKSPTNSTTSPETMIGGELTAGVSVEPELQHGATTFVTLESDLGTLFGPPSNPDNSQQQQQHFHVPSSSSSSSLSMSFSRSDFEQELMQLKDKEIETRRELSETKEREINNQHKIKQLQSTIDQLELDNIDLSEEVARVSRENRGLKEDSELQVQDIQSTVHDLKMNLKEKEEDVSVSASLMLCCVVFVSV